MNHVSITGLCHRLIGQAVPTNQHGHAGRYIEDRIEGMGIRINRGAGCDILVLGLELKSRDLGATSPQNISTMTPQQVCNTAYRDSVIFDKFQQQLRVFTQDQFIVDAGVYDFSPEHIQHLIEQAYEHGRAEIQRCMAAPNSVLPVYVYGTEYGYWERICGASSFTFRINAGAYEKLERMACSTFVDFFEFA